MKMVEISHNNERGIFFEERRFDLIDEMGIDVCHLMIMVDAPGEEFEISVTTSPEYFNKGYATEGICRLIDWGVKNGYKSVRMTNLFGSEAINHICTKLGFTKQRSNVWTKTIVGPLGS